MIKCNLAVLLAERGLKMADVINDTSLSKTAVRGLYYNESKGIQFETLETICDYLNVSPDDVIKKIHFSHELLERKINKETKSIDYRILFELDNKKYEHIIRINFKRIVNEISKERDLPGLYLDFIFEKDIKHNILSQITLAERLRFEDILAHDYRECMNLQEHPLREIFYNNAEN
jgi:DNA-binding Xre family transcriptional regulator